MSDNILANTVVLLTFITLVYKYIINDKYMSFNEKSYSLLIVTLCTIGLIMGTVFNGIIIFLLLCFSFLLNHKIERNICFACFAFITYIILQTIIIFNGKVYDSAFDPYMGMIEYIMYTLFIISLCIYKNDVLKRKIIYLVITFSLSYYVIGTIEVINNVAAGQIFNRTSSSFTNPNLFGAYASIILIYLILNKNIFKKRDYNIILIFSIIFVLLSASRATWFGLGLCGIYKFMKDRKLNLKYIALSLVIVFSLLVINDILDNILIERVLTAFDSEDASTSDRLLLIQVSLEIIGQYFFFGAGIRTFNSERITRGYILNGTVTHPHNAFLELFVTLGIIGFILQLIIVYILFKRKKNRDTNVSNYIVFFFALSLFSRLFNSYPISILFWLILAL